MARLPSYTTALNRALQQLDTRPVDQAAVRLARGYARTLDDDPDALAKVGPQLLATLAALGMTPAARGAGKGVSGGNTPAGPLDELRARRRERSTAAGDPAAS